VSALEDPNEGVRLRAARALGQIGPEARSAAAALQRATGDPDGGVRREAQQALEQLQRH
jgi:HEAT repeat protein